MLVQLDISGGDEIAADTAIAQVLDARTGEPDTDILQGDVCRGVGRAEDDGVDDLAFGPRRGEIVVVFGESEEDARRRARVDDEGQPLVDTHGTRAYRYHWQRRRAVGRAFKTDPGPITFSLSPGGTLLGYVAPLQNVLCVYGVQAERDRILAGEHQTRREAEGFGGVAIDVPFYSGILISNTYAVVSRDSPGGPAPAMVFVINLTNGQVEARIETLGGHVEFDVDFDRERIAVTGSAKHLALYDFAGNELYLEEDATAHRNHAIALSPDGRRVALGGDENTVRVYDISRR
ncbi:WD40 repeat domain-containing protein [Phycisphaeraceae bacterium D3-23]